MKKFLLLTVFFSIPAAAEVFMLAETGDVLYDSQYPLNEYVVSDTQNNCFFHYLTTDEVTSDYTIQFQNQSYPDICLKKGFVNLNLFDENKQRIGSWNGYFMDGFFIGNLPLNAKAIKRSSDENGSQYLYYLIDEDRQLGIRYIGTMHSFLNEKGKYSPFDACHPFEITLQTSNRALFENTDTFKNLLTVVEGYAQTLCPEAQTIVMKASDSPSLERNAVYYTQNLFFDGISWKMENVPVLKKAEKAEKKTVSHKRQYKTAHELLALSRKTSVPVLGEFTVHISNKTNESVVFADKPFIMKALSNSLNLKEGWYHIQATIQEMDDFEKKRSGLSLNEKAAILVIQQASVCSDCAQLIEMKRE